MAEHALAQIPRAHVEGIEPLLRVDTAGATRALLDWCHDAQIRYSVGYDLTEPVRAAIFATPAHAWIAAVEHGSDRRNGELCEITDQLDLGSWPTDSRVLIRRERPHPGAQLAFTDHDGYRFQATLTDQPNTDIALLERRHRAARTSRTTSATTRTPA